MRSRWRMTVALVLLAPLLRGAERDLVRTFPATPGCAVSIDTYRGAITIQEADTAEIRVAVHLEIGAKDDAEAESMLRSLELQIGADGLGVRVVARRPVETRARFVWNDHRQIEPTYRVTVPARCDVTLRTGDGPIIVGNLVGRVRAHSAHGDVFLRHVTGAAEARADHGDVVVSRCTGSLTATVAHGNMRIGTVTGRCEVKDASGDIELLAPKAEVRAFTEAGTLTVGIPKDFTGPAEIRTSGGAIVAAVDPTASCRIDASASWLAHVRVEMPLHVDAGQPGGRRVVGQLNGGHAALVLHASGGDVVIRRGQTLF